VAYIGGRREEGVDEAWFDESEYVGGLSDAPKRERGTFGVWPYGAGIVARHRDMELVLVVPREDIASIEVADGGQLAKSRVLPVLVFGILGLAARGADTQTVVIVRSKNGENAYFIISNTTHYPVKAKLAPVLEHLGIREPDGASAETPDLASQLEHLADLHERGLLTDDELAAAKATLLP
jgi:hypothetical protein